MKRIFKIIGKYILISLIFNLFVLNIYSQDEKSITINSNLKIDFLKVVSGGKKQNSSYVGLFDVSLLFNTEKLKLWKGGSFFIQGLNKFGKQPSSEIIGDLLVASNLDAQNNFFLYEFWYNHNFDNLSIKLGQIDLNANYMVNEYAGCMINSAFGVIPVVSANIPVSIFPNTTLGMITEYKINENHHIKFSLFDGIPNSFEENKHNLKFKLDKNEGYNSFTEYTYTSLKKGIPTLKSKIGLYYHSKEFTNYSKVDSLGAKKEKNNFGIYVMTDKILYTNKSDSDKTLGLFNELAYCLSEINVVNFFFGGGIELSGYIPKRNNDKICIALAYANISSCFRSYYLNSPKKNETVIEAAYKLNFKHLLIQPEIQYIINPGANRILNDALIALVRFHFKLNN